MPEFTEPENWLPNTGSSDLNPVLFSVGALQQMVCRHKISDIDQLKRVLIDWWAQLGAGHIEPNDQSAAKILTMVIKAKSAHVEFRLE